jgi:hypothetical protein
MLAFPASILGREQPERKERKKKKQLNNSMQRFG